MNIIREMSNRKPITNRKRSTSDSSGTSFDSSFGERICYDDRPGMNKRQKVNINDVTYQMQEQGQHRRSTDIATAYSTTADSNRNNGEEEASVMIGHSLEGRPLMVSEVVARQLTTRSPSINMMRNPPQSLATTNISVEELLAIRRLRQLQEQQQLQEEELFLQQQQQQQLRHRRRLRQLLANQEQALLGSAGVATTSLHQRFSSLLAPERLAGLLLPPDALLSNSSSSSSQLRRNLSGMALQDYDATAGVSSLHEQSPLLAPQLPTSVASGPVPSLSSSDTTHLMRSSSSSRPPSSCSLLDLESQMPRRPSQEDISATSDINELMEDDRCDFTKNPFIMYRPNDDQNLSDYQCLVRKQIEFFAATSTNLLTSVQGRNRPIILDQVGIRCVYCAKLSRGNSGSSQTRTLGGSHYFPSKLQGIYQAAQNIATNHLCSNCTEIPLSAKKKLRELCRNKSPAHAGISYWAAAGAARNIKEVNGRLRFGERQEE